MWMRKGVVGKRNNKLEKLKRKINTMLSGWEKVSQRKEIKNLEKIKGKKIECGGESGRSVV